MKLSSLFPRMFFLLALFLLPIGCGVMAGKQAAVPEGYDRLHDRDHVLISVPENRTVKGLSFDDAVADIGRGETSHLITNFPDRERTLQNTIFDILNGNGPKSGSNNDLVFIPYEPAPELYQKTFRVQEYNESISPDLPGTKINNHVTDPKVNILITGRLEHATVATGSRAESVTDRILPEDTGYLAAETKWTVYDLDNEQVILTTTIKDEDLVDLSRYRDPVHKLQQAEVAFGRLLERIAWNLCSQLIPHYHYSERPSSPPPEEEESLQAEQLWESD